MFHKKTTANFITITFAILIVAQVFGFLIISTDTDNSALAALSKGSNPLDNLQVKIPGLELAAKDQAIGAYISGIYRYAVGSVGLLATVVMMFAGMLWITAAGNTEQISKAKSYMTASLTGLVLTLASWMILYQVNPDLIKFTSIKVISVEERNEVSTAGRGAGLFRNCIDSLSSGCDGYCSSGNCQTFGLPGSERCECANTGLSFTECSEIVDLGQCSIGRCAAGRQCTSNGNNCTCADSPELRDCEINGGVSISGLGGDARARCITLRDTNKCERMDFSAIVNDYLYCCKTTECDTSPLGCCLLGRSGNEYNDCEDGNDDMTQQYCGEISGVWGGAGLTCYDKANYNPFDDDFECR